MRTYASHILEDAHIRVPCQACSDVQVGSLLLAFLPTSLQEQISSRKYFYKSGRLIKDGIITLSNTDFSRDIMDQVGLLLTKPFWCACLWSTQCDAGQGPVKHCAAACP